MRVEPLVQGDLTKEPLFNRKAILAAIVKEQPRYVEVLPFVRINATVEHCQTARQRLATVVEHFERSILNRQEGIMIKRADSIYETGMRACAAGEPRGESGSCPYASVATLTLARPLLPLAGSKWTRKLKPDYASGATQTLDVVILGAYYGVGTRRAKAPSHFLLGVATATPGKFLPFGTCVSVLGDHTTRDVFLYLLLCTCTSSVAKVGSGYSLTELKVP